MKSYRITYMTEAGKNVTILHWSLRNEDWKKVADKEAGTVMEVLEEISYSKWSGTKCRVLMDAKIGGRMKGDIVYV